MTVQPMSCERSHALMTRYVDGELEEALAAPLRRHLLECNGCRGLAVETKNLRAWMEPRPAPAIPTGFAARVAERAFSGAEPVVTLRPVGGSESSIPHLQAFVLAATAVAAGVLFFLALGLGFANRPGGESLEAAPYTEALELLEELERQEQADAEKALPGGPKAR